MSEPPRRGRVTTEERQRNLGKGVAGSPQQGSTRYDRRADTHPSGGSQGGNIVVVIHGDDGTVARPAASVVYWVGAATPENGVAFDFWFTADVV